MWISSHLFDFACRMTGVDGRPEVVIQGSNSMLESDWIEYEFLYKPGNVSRPPPFVGNVIFLYHHEFFVCCYVW